ncbi:ParB/RepB/Spo0J family partition protein [Azospirillum sp. TSO35-2]|uniref:ParB/RepB/Spo0J family partition protein n=1 Tax=Azospirillum sp. TSO35-2 TaxID=716796 RepID=UPI0018EE7CAB|nr:ParB/RepB/Spo0J family partition protein [Azospirillum sp. TSO35-2]
MLGMLGNAIAEQQEGSRVMEVEVSWVDPNPGQPRKHFDAESIQALADSIESHGLQQPIGLQHQDSGRYRLVFGERRLRAYRLLGRRTIPAILVDPKVPADEAALIENVIRKDLTPFEEADALKALYDRHKLSYATLARLVGRSKSGIDREMSLVRICAEVRAEYVEHTPPLSVLYEIARIEDPIEQVGAWENYKALRRAERLPEPGSGDDDDTGRRPAAGGSGGARSTATYKTALPAAMARRIFGGASAIQALGRDEKRIAALLPDDIAAFKAMRAEIDELLKRAEETLADAD